MAAEPYDFGVLSDFHLPLKPLYSPYLTSIV